MKNGTGFLVFLLASFFPAFSLQAAVTFSFSQSVRFFINPDPDPDFLPGDTLSGTFTFDPSAPSSVLPTNEGYVNFESAVISWSVIMPRQGLTFSGTAGSIILGNDTPFYLSDRYVVTLFTGESPNPAFPSGRTLRFVQIDLFDIENVFNPRPADLLVDSLLPATPPDLSLITSATQGTATGSVRFNENNNQLQTRLISLNAVPEPGIFLYGAVLLLPMVRSRSRPKYRLDS